ncbi:Peptidase A1 [Corchorus capsularis]|uniref:Peptidase A1 n=1 Tax=Corchorus capsularis TaxID=210143 RepID=A0A1R3IUB6_COCAP|nr:Peptidase A1 [Corchorus capsularis]
MDPNITSPSSVGFSLQNHPARLSAFLEIYLGTPPQKLQMFVDTSSPLTWVECMSCAIRTCMDDDEADFQFNEERYTTYTLIYSNTDICNDLSFENSIFERAGKCEFNSTYADGDWSSGLISTDVFSAFKVYNATTTVPTPILNNFIFGCSQESTMNHGDFTDIYGILALLPTPKGFLRQVGVNKFSHCFYPYSRGRWHNFLHFGNQAQLLGNSFDIVPAERFQVLGRYSLALYGISVGGKALPLPDEFLIGTQSRGTLFLDTGTPHTHLYGDAFYRLAEELQTQIGNIYPSRGGSLCYENLLIKDIRDIESLPKVTFHFKDFDFEIQNIGLYMVYPWSDMICLHIARATRPSSNVIGLTAMMNHNIGYHIDYKKIYIQRQDCTPP